MRIAMKSAIVFILLFTCIGLLDAQSVRLTPVVHPTQGAHYRVGNTALSWTIGEPAHSTLRNGNLMLTQGFQQPIVAGIMVLAAVVHKSQYHKGAIYIEATGGVPPYRYNWDSVPVAPSVIIIDSLFSKLAGLGIDSTIVFGIDSDFSTPDQIVGIDTGIYSVSVQDSRGYTVHKSYRVGNVSRFLITANTLSNDDGVISKTSSVPGWQNNICASIIPVGDSSDTGFEFQVLDTGKFDFGFRDISVEAMTDTLFDANSFSYGADEYYQLAIRNGMVSYYSANAGSVINITTVMPNDIISLLAEGNHLVFKKNGHTYLTRPRESNATRKLFTIGRIYHEASSFKILENVVY